MKLGGRHVMENTGSWKEEMWLYYYDHISSYTYMKFSKLKKKLRNHKDSSKIGKSMPYGYNPNIFFCK